MPELPEVEIVRQQLEKKVIGKTISDIEVRAWKSVGNDRYFVKELIGKRFKKVDRKGKYLFFELENKSEASSYIICHLKMTGRLIYETPKKKNKYGGGHKLPNSDDNRTPDLNYKKDQPHSHTRVIFTFKDGSHLYFNDMRKFGFLKRTDNEGIEAQKDKIGIEPIGSDYKMKWFREIFAGRQTSVKAVLLDQKRVAGLGNIYVDEACFRAQVRPDRTAASLSESEIDKLFEACRDVLEEALELGGTTFRDFADTGGESGNFTDNLQVFAREGESCMNSCGKSIKKTRVAGRGTHFCPHCQK